MKRSRYTEEQIIGILKEQEAGVPVAELCRKHGMSDARFYNWKSKYGGLEVSEAKRLLAHTDMPVYLIAVSLGFDEATNFAKFFRREVRRAPGEFRQQHAGRHGHLFAPHIDG